MIARKVIQPDDKQVMLIDFLISEKSKIESSHEFWQKNRNEIGFSSNLDEKKAKSSHNGAMSSLFGFFSSEPKEETKKKREEKIEKYISKTPFEGDNFIQGSYVWGDTGCGKTFLLDLFFDNLEIPEKKRFHYNKFMLRIHKSNFKYYNVVL